MSLSNQTYGTKRTGGNTYIGTYAHVNFINLGIYYSLSFSLESFVIVVTAIIDNINLKFLIIWS